MTQLDTLIITALLPLLATLFAGRQRWIGWLATALYALLLLLLITMGGLGYGGEAIDASLTLTIMDQTLQWRFDALSWFFAIITVGAALASSCFAAGAWGDKYREDGGNLQILHIALAANVLAMLILLASGDLLSLFIGWELVSWASFLMMVIGGALARRAALQYITYATAGAMAILAGMALVFQISGSLDYQSLLNSVVQLDGSQITLLTLLFGVGFAIKMGVMPFHLWQATAYAETPGPGTAFLGAISSRMGLYAILVVLVQLIGIAQVDAVKLAFSFTLRDALMWIAAFTIILPTFTALKQNDARRLLAWHGIGQGGYMLMGLLLADAIGSAGGLMHVFNHATYQAALFFSVYAVIYRTGTSDLNRLGGLVVRMPLSFLAMLVGIIGLAGIPPMNGFVSKWLIYRALITEGMPLLFVATVIGTLGTILSVYKLIHNTYLGQLRAEHMEVREVPWSMLLPMLLLSAVVFISGFMPGLVLEWIAAIQGAVGLPVIAPTLGGVELENGGLDMLWVVTILFAGFGIGALLFYVGGNRSQRVHQLDNYAGGHFLTADTRYHYSNNFYAGLMHLIGPWYRATLYNLEQGIINTLSLLSTWSSWFFNSFHPSLYLLAFVVVTLGWMVN